MKIISRIGMIALLIGLIGSCSKDISVGGDDATTNKNVAINVFFAYNGSPVHKDSIYQDIAGNFYSIDKVKMIISDFFIYNAGDSIVDTTNFFVASPDQFSYDVLDIPAGSYAGSYGFKIGLDGFDNMKEPNDFTMNSGLRDSDLYRGPSGVKRGFNFLYVEGRILDLSDSTGSEVVYKYEMADTLMLPRARIKNFTISNEQKAHFDIVVNVDKIMQPFDVVQVDEIESRSTDAGDYDNAILLRTQLDSSMIMF